MAKVSILMNGFNSEKYLKEAIDSVYNQNFKDWEIVFIDNCSTDNTKKIVKSYDEKIKYFKTEENIPLGEARNFGLKKCKGTYLAFLDTDDIWLFDKLNKQVNFMDNNLSYQMSYGGVIYIDENSSEIGTLIPNAIDGNVFPQQLKRYEINMQSVLIRNNIFIEFNETMQFSPDYDLFMKISSKYKVAVIKDFIVKYRKLKNSLTSQTISRWGLEMKETLDFIFKENLDFKNKYLKEYNLAYAKVAYNKAQYLIHCDNKKEATLVLSEYKFTDIKYFILYLVSMFPTLFWKQIHKYK